MSAEFSQKETSTNEVIHMVSDLVAAYVSNNSVESTEIPDIIHKVYATLTNLGGQHRFLHDRPEPAVPIKKSIMDSHIVCLEDGKKLKMLKRHLKTAYNMTPEQYRERWGLPLDYPMVAPDYAKRRSDLAKTNGLGRSRGRSPSEMLAS